MDNTLALKLSLEYIQGTDIAQFIELRHVSKTIQMEIDLILKQRYRRIFKEGPPENIGEIIYKLREIYDLPICSRCASRNIKQLFNLYKEEVLGKYHTNGSRVERKCGRIGCIGHYMTINGALK